MPETFTFYIQPWYRKSPYFEATKRAGCTSWGLYNHMLLPTLYDDPVTEYWALLRDVTMWDVSVERCVEISGPDAFQFTNLLTCRDLTTCEVGQCKYVLITDRRRRHRERSGPAPHRRGSVLARARRLRCAPLREGCRRPRRDGRHGRSRRTSRRCRSRARDRRTSCAISLGDEIAELRYYRCAEAEIDGIPLVVSRTGWTGEVGYELYLRDASRGDELWRLVEEAGAPVRDPRDRAVGGAADRGGHLQLRLGHAHRGHAVPRHRARAVRRARPGRRLHREGRAAPDRRGRGGPEARRDRHRRRADERRGRPERLLAGPRAGRGPDRSCHRRRVVAAPGAEHRLRLGSGNTHGRRHGTAL